MTDAAISREARIETGSGLRQDKWIKEWCYDGIGRNHERSAAAMGEQLMEHVLKTDPEIKTLLGQLAKERVKRALRDLGVKASGTER